MLDKLLFYIRHSLNDLRINGQRTLFALLCIAAGVAAIVSLQTLGVMIEDTLTGSLRETNRGDIRLFPNPTFGESVEDSLREQDGIVRPELGDETFGNVFVPEGLEALETWFAENVEGEVRLTHQNVGALRSTSGISISHPENNLDRFPVLSFIIESENYPVFGTVESLDGRPLDSLLQAPTDIVLSENLAEDLDAAVGDTVRVNGASEEFTVSGIVPTDAEGGLRNFIASIMGYYYLDVRSITLFGDMEPNYATTIFVGLPDADMVDEVADALDERYPYLSLSTTTDLKDQNTFISDTVDNMVSIMGLVSMLIGGIGIVNTMLVIVSRRATEVAILKTLGLEPNQVTILFMVEAFIMGILGSLLGILLGWLMAFALQGIAEQFIAQSLSFRPTLMPALNGFVVGVLVTVIFGFLPTLTAGQIRPANVLRPSDTLLPKSGRLRSFAVVMIVLLALSLVAQGLIGDLLNFDTSIGSMVDSAADAQLESDPNAQVSTSEDVPAGLRDVRLFNVVTGVNGAILGLLLVIPVILGGILSMRQERRGRSWLLYGLLWLLLLVAVPMLVFAFGYFVPTVLLATVTFIIVGSLYLLLMLLIWAVGGGALKEFPVLGNLPGPLRLLAFAGAILWTAFVVFIVVVVKPSSLILAAFLGLLFFIHIPAIIITMTLPAWILGQLLQRFGFLDLKIALRSMVSTKARGASTLLALVIGVFTLSLITMLVDTILTQFEELLEDQTGGNLIVFPAMTAGGDETLTHIETTLSEHPGVHSYAFTRTYEGRFVSIEDVSQGETLDSDALLTRLEAELGEGGFFSPEETLSALEFSLNRLDARDLDSNLPAVRFSSGRQLDPLLDSRPDEDGFWPIIISDSLGVQAADIEAGDLLTLAFASDGSDTQTFRIVGIVNTSSGSAQGITSSSYAPTPALSGRDPSQVIAIADVSEAEVSEVRRDLMQDPMVFALETRLLNDLISSIVRQFTSFPILVAALALFTGGIVIANAVALSTMERRREIGIMKAVGLQRERVLGMLLLENGIMGFIGGLIGVGISVLLLILLFVVVFSGDLGDAVPIVPALLLMLLCVGIALVAAIISVCGASGEKPLNVLRYE